MKNGGKCFVCGQPTDENEVTCGNKGCNKVSYEFDKVKKENSRKKEVKLEDLVVPSEQKEGENGIKDKS